MVTCFRKCLLIKHYLVKQDSFFRTFKKILGRKLVMYFEAKKFSTIFFQFRKKKFVKIGTLENAIDTKKTGIRDLLYSVVSVFINCAVVSLTT